MQANLNCNLSMLIYRAMITSVDILNRNEAPMSRAEQLKRLAAIAGAMDTAFRIPFTKIRFGADSLLGLVPGVGDIAGLAVQAYVLHAAYRLGIPRKLMVKMLGNAAIDMTLGAVPIVGDVFDLFFKSNTRNLKLILDYFEPKRPASTASYSD
jgi:hypothetical protein